MKRKKILLIIGLLVGLGLVGSSLAYFYVNASSTHSYNIGYNTIETKRDITGLTFSNYSNYWYNYNTYKNNGVVDCVIRAKISLNNYAYKDLITYNIGDGWELVDGTPSDETQTPEENNEEAKDNRYDRDIWYYYKGVLKPGEETTPLISFIRTLGYNNNNSKLNLIVYTESVEYTENTVDLEQVKQAFKSIEYPSYLLEGD